MDDPVRLLDQLFAGKLRAQLDDVHISMPGRIESYDPKTQKASVQPLVKRGFIGEDGERQTELLPVVPDVPVEFFGGGDYYLTFPITAGMTCRLAFCSVSLDRWLARGGEVDPGDDRRGHLTDAVCVVGLRDFAHPIRNLPSTGWVLAAPTGTPIRLGSTTTSSPTIKGDAHQLAMSTFLTTLGSYLAACTGPLPAEKTAMATAIAALQTALGTMQTVKVKVE